MEKNCNKYYLTEAGENDLQQLDCKRRINKYTKKDVCIQLNSNAC